MYSTVWSNIGVFSGDLLELVGRGVAGCTKVSLSSEIQPLDMSQLQKRGVLWRALPHCL